MNLFEKFLNENIVPFFINKILPELKNRGLIEWKKPWDSVLERDSFSVDIDRDDRKQVCFFLDEKLHGEICAYTVSINSSDIAPEKPCIKVYFLLDHEAETILGEFKEKIVEQFNKTFNTKPFKMKTQDWNFIREWIFVGRNGEIAPWQDTVGR